MKTYKWETIKKKAKYQLMCKLSPSHAGVCGDALFTALLPAISTGTQPKILLEEWHKEADLIIDRWDVRRVKHLITCFPEIVTHWCLDKPIACEYDTKGEWTVTFGHPPTFCESCNQEVI